jgi:hypothetical protein
MAKKTLDEINEETERNLKTNREIRLKDGQLDRIEDMLYKLKKKLDAMTYFGGLGLLILLVLNY